MSSIFFGVPGVESCLGITGSNSTTDTFEKGFVIFADTFISGVTRIYDLAQCGNFTDAGGSCYPPGLGPSTNPIPMFTITTSGIDADALEDAARHFGNQDVCPPHSALAVVALIALVVLALGALAITCWAQRTGRMKQCIESQNNNKALGRYEGDVDSEEARNDYSASGSGSEGRVDDPVDPLLPEVTGAVRYGATN